MTAAEGKHPPDLPHRGSGRAWRAALCLLPAIALGIVTLPHLYRDSFGDPDTLLMINGVLEFPARADQWNPSHKYGVLFSWGYYWLLYHLPAHVREHASSLIAAVNAIGWASAVLACAALGWLARRLHGLETSLALTIPVAFSPMVLELATYGHPFMLSVALLFGAGIALIEAEALAGAAALATRALSALLLFMSLAVRAESLLALPWLALVTPVHGAARPLLRRVATRGLVFASAFAAFLWIQRGIAGEHGLVFASLGAFFRSFYDTAKLLRGLAVLALSSGLALIAVTPLLALRTWANPGAARATRPPLVLLGTALLFWLPNPTPSRHFFFALAALSERFALSGVRQLGARRAIVLALAVVVLNQAGAELLYRPITRQYWSAGSGSRRLATGSVPIGASLPYHAAVQSVHAELREEGRRLARVPDPEVVFFGDAGDYLVLALLERGGPRAWVDTAEAGFWVSRIDRAGQTFHIVTKSRYRPHDVAAEYLAIDPFPRAKIYVQPSTRSRFDRAAIPPERTLVLP